MKKKANKINNESRCFMVVYKRCMREFFNLESFRDLVPLIENVDVSITIEEKIDNINILIDEILKVFKKMDYLMHCAITMINSLKGINLIRKLELRSKIKETDKMMMCLFEFEKYSISQLEFLKDQLNIKVVE